ncbi:MAG: ATP-binding cassette domain-containing protein [Myxococcota bacterium]|nr:peptide ABC transporter substrate-binding protein [Deltaproteobacteria bacterium]MCP4240401.1 ATP-binding cassette domain-containing protein [bacterium]MDP6074765.1 ATP-binding cassette domain-containing protein [Myxococcota bacterium]MDP6242815.1 ATP-binding cassette domain-containing protein [Myxococcota bacterium]MDP7076324.1 ATP-binding cassette domain-containing protein [Myxococcota bacterium]
MSTQGALLEVRGLKKYFPVRGGVFSTVGTWVKAVDGVSFDIARSEVFALVGESGCGKTTTGRTLLRLVEPTEGHVAFDGQPVFELSARDLRALRRRMQIIFQDPYGSLNPRMTVGAIVGEPLRVHGLAAGAELDERVGELLERVGLAPDYRTRYPHEFSGGQRQRIGIARALALGPDLIVCDEAVSALDVSIQAQILNLLQELQRDLGLSYLFITHDLNVVQHLADRVGVMYLGRLVETADAEDLFREPLHPYTQALISANPVPDPSIDLEPQVLMGEVPSPLAPPPGCHFHPRCPHTTERCRREIPLPLTRGTRQVACHLYDER